MIPIIEIKDLSKRYDITHQRGGYVALRDVIAGVFKNPFKFLKHKTKIILGRETKEEFWALKDINFTVHKGEAIGIIGANGAGKSTLLKILSKITPPTTGEVILRGRVASLLEVGTGFHPELTGRENIFLNGAILGMSSKEMAKKFDDIVKFSGVEKFLDTPVKRYSSWMYVRLAFSVAAHMEPDILIVDEVLAVGDAEFQKKCLGKMDEVAQTEGRTVLFVSHNMSAIQSLCQKTILLENGKIKMIGDTTKVVAGYLENNPLTQNEESLRARRDRKGGGRVKFTTFWIENNDGQKIKTLINGGFYTFCFGYESLEQYQPKDLNIDMAISQSDNSPLIFISTKFQQGIKTPPTHGVIRCSIPQKFPLAEGVYNISINLFSGGNQEDFIKRFSSFEVKDGNFFPGGIMVKHSPIYLEQKWSINNE